jgi:hypothetical protein
MYERAIAADNYFEDQESTLNYYNVYIEKYSAEGNKELIYLAKTRVKHIKQEMHLNEE